MKTTLPAIIIVILLAVITAGCQSSGNSAQHNPSAPTNATAETGTTVVTNEQLSKLTTEMTYKEAVNILGKGKDTGSGLYIIQYAYAEDQQLTLNFSSYDERVTDEDYAEISELIGR